MTIKVDPLKLRKVVESAWCPETMSLNYTWNPENPARGQCSATALVVQDYLGGEIIWSVFQEPGYVDWGRHMSNRIEGKHIDLTHKQFPDGTIHHNLDDVVANGLKGIRKKSFTPDDMRKKYGSIRGWLLSYPDIKEQYEILKKRVGEARISSSQPVYYPN